jgi:hypothetical protein
LVGKIGCAAFILHQDGAIFLQLSFCCLSRQPAKIKSFLKTAKVRGQINGMQNRLFGIPHQDGAIFLQLSFCYLSRQSDKLK